MKEARFAFTSLEICAGAGGQAIGLEQAGFEHLALVELDEFACTTLRHNRPNWNIIEGDIRSFDASPYKGVDLFSGGVPCPPFSVAGKQLGYDDERDLFPEALRIVEQTCPKAVMIENVKGLMSNKFANYRKQILGRLLELGYRGDMEAVVFCRLWCTAATPESASCCFSGSVLELLPMACASA